ncbi:unnamed protein product [Cuscuta campestris]|uniref:Uncharacterized protein n=1 Tax=Cuscuta campestris TaxID=132261 RepID=A0A484KH87_9ASTE|nr:unnamed protein product [Cuscuta campestris]
MGMRWMEPWRFGASWTSTLGGCPLPSSSFLRFFGLYKQAREGGYFLCSSVLPFQGFFGPYKLCLALTAILTFSAYVFVLFYAFLFMDS